MKKSMLIMAIVLATGSMVNGVLAQTTADSEKKTTAANTLPAATGDVVTVIDGNANYTTAALAVKTADLESSLKADGPFTVFVPNNAAFSKIPQTRLDSLMKNQTQLAAVLKGHVVNGKLTKTDIIKALVSGKGTATLKSIDGRPITLSVNANKNLVLTDDQGDTAEVTSFDMNATNGIVHGINGVLMK